MRITSKKQEKCRNPKIASYMDEYLFRLFKEDNPDDRRRQREFESHLTECEVCRADVENLKEFIEDCRQNRDLLPDPSTTGRKSTWITGLLQRPALALVSALLVLVLGGTGLVRHDSERQKARMTSLATVEPEREEQMVLRGSGLLAILLSEAEDDFHRKDFAAAEPKLAEYVKQDPNHALAFYCLGVSRMMLGKFNESREPFRACVARAQGSLQEDGRWRLANASLKMGDADEALRELEAIVAGHGARKKEAEALIFNINEIKKSSWLGKLIQ